MREGGMPLDFAEYTAPRLPL